MVTMTVFIDPPRWPAHGTVFSHLVSDQSLAELHEFASRLGVSVRAFDQDHYDIPAHRLADALALGAVAVEGKDLARILIRSGLRVPARRRPAKLAPALTRRWERHVPGHPDLGSHLLERWLEPHRAYHGPAHLLKVLEAVDLLTDGRPSQELVLAAWFHDAVHRGRAGEDEKDSAALARQLLGPDGCAPESPPPAGRGGAGRSPVQEGSGEGDAAPGSGVRAAPREGRGPGAAEPWPAGLADRVAELVMVTVAHRPDPTDRDACLLVDADLAVLGGTAEEYERYRADVRREYADVPESQFRAARAEVLQNLLSSPRLFHHDTAVALWETQARRNVAREIQLLTGQ